MLRRLTFDGRPESLVTISLTRSNSPVLYIYTRSRTQKRASCCCHLTDKNNDTERQSCFFSFFSSFPICCCCLHFGVSNDAIAREKKNMRVFILFFFFPKRKTTRRARCRPKMKMMDSLEEITEKSLLAEEDTGTRHPPKKKTSPRK